MLSPTSFVVALGLIPASNLRPIPSLRVQIVLSCLPGAPLSNAPSGISKASLCWAAGRRAHPQNLPRTGPFAIEIVLKVRQHPAPFQNRDCLAGYPIDPFLPPWCLPGCPIDPFLPPWCLPGCLAPRKLSKWLFPASLVPPWCLAGCPIDPFLLPWCLASCPMSPFLPPWCLSGCPKNGPFLPPWCLPVKGNSICAGQPAVAPIPGFAANRAVRH